MSILMVVSSLYMALPVAIIGYEFTVIWGDRQHILLATKTKDRLAKWGWGARDLPDLFRLFDLDNDKEMELEEFENLMIELDMGFVSSEIHGLFKNIDKDACGTIDTKEFIKAIYPDEYRSIYGGRRMSFSGSQGGSILNLRTRSAGNTFTTDT